MKKSYIMILLNFFVAQGCDRCKHKYTMNPKGLLTIFALKGRLVLIY